MKNFYLLRLAQRPPQERQAYLDSTVAASLRDAVREAWNEAHPDQTLE